VQNVRIDSRTRQGSKSLSVKAATRKVPACISSATSAQTRERRLRYLRTFFLSQTSICQPAMCCHTPPFSCSHSFDYLPSPSFTPPLRRSRGCAAQARYTFLGCSSFPSSRWLCGRPGCLASPRPYVDCGAVPRGCWLHVYQHEIQWCVSKSCRGSHQWLMEAIQVLPFMSSLSCRISRQILAWRAPYGAGFSSTA
jgi:hypothetical protein